MSQPPRESKSKLNYDESSRQLQRAQPDGPTEAIARHRAFLDPRLSQIAKWCTQGVKPEALVRFALMDMAGDKGAKLRECTQQSIYLGLLACAVTGLEPGALRGEAYLVPYRNKGVMEATFMPGWKGLVKQARRSREVVSIYSNVVLKGDFFDIDLGSGKPPVHKPGEERGEVEKAYAVAYLSNGFTEVEFMDKHDLEAVRRAGSNGPAWADWSDQMYRKAPIRRLCKRLPMGADYFVALALEQASDVSQQAKVLDLETNGEGERAQNQAGVSAEMAAQVGEPDEDELREIAERERREANA